MSQDKNITYEAMTTANDVLCVSVAYRKDRMPIRRARITPYGEVRLEGRDGMIEVLGSPKEPCPERMLHKMRTHHEGLLLVEFLQESVDAMPRPVNEQFIKDNYFSTPSP